MLLLNNESIHYIHDFKFFDSKSCDVKWTNLFHTTNYFIKKLLTELGDELELGPKIKN